MKSYHMNMGAGLQGLVLREHARPEPGPGEVLVRVHAVSLNFREIMILIQGRYPLPVKPDVVAVSDGAGEVVAVGERVTRTRVGDRVIASIFPRWQDGPFGIAHADQLGGSLDGMLTQYRALNEDALVPVPSHLSYEEAATLPCAGVTAWNALFGGKTVLPGESVLTLGTGSVSLFALQFAKMAGARVIATTSSGEKAQRLRALGADEVVNYRDLPQWAAEVRRLTGGRGVDHVVEVGGATLAQSLQACAMGGELALIGSVAGGGAAVEVNTLIASGASVRPIAVGSRAQLANMARAIGANAARPVIDRVFTFDQAPAAFAYYAEGKCFGKVVVKVSD
ncbi:MAG TPA: NAD(P)-dependent alcohol dehydrogenase [Burkholderiaceae bacterium]|nr:NAD(P)-dependent alcohol dehydrogenase [Burkholderiaceae bacterium]